MSWVNLSDDPSSDIGAFVFRLRFDLDDVPDHLLIEVSADPRYRLYLNGTLVSIGPQRGDLDCWFYDTVNLAEHARKGQNELKAIVWNHGFLSPMAQMSLRTALMVRCPLRPELATPGKWEVARLEGYSFARDFAEPNAFYHVVGPGERVDGRAWREPRELDWHSAHPVSPVRERGSTYEPLWALTPRTIPPVRYERRALAPRVRRGHRGDPTPDRPESALVLPLSLEPGLHVFDFGELLNAYPRAVLAGAEGSKVELIYDEALWTDEVSAGAYGSQRTKGHRSEVSGKHPRGLRDTVTLGTAPMEFEPLWWRSFRYLSVQTSAPVVVHALDAFETGYPYAVESTFEAEALEVERIWSVAIRTAQRCADETYFDCPAYEQLQYVGDTRIQAMIHRYLSRDRRLVAAALDAFRRSVLPDGLTQSRFPNRTTQRIPTFSLIWVLMLHDRWMYDPAGQPSELDLRLAAGVIAECQRLRDEAPLVHWPFVDWVPGWKDGHPGGGMRATPNVLLLALAECALAEMSGSTRRGLPEGVTRQDGWIRHALDDSWQPSEHSEALWQLLQRAHGQTEDPWPSESDSAAKATLYFSYYTHQARRFDDYRAALAPWNAMIECGLSTFAETPDPARSDCHAWSAHPVLGFLQIVAGITSAAPGWSRARIEPKPGSIGRFSAAVAHPAGPLHVTWDGARYKVVSPVPFDFVQAGQSRAYASGEHRL